MISGQTWGLKAGQWKDDTSTALCFASSLIDKNGFDPYDQVVRYKWWHQYGYMSSTGRCFDIGNTALHSIQTFVHCQKSLLQENSTTFDIYCDAPDGTGNGRLMRLAPIPLFFYRNPEKAVEYAGLSTRLTHGDTRTIDASRYYAALIVAAISGETKEQLLNKQFYESHKEWFGVKRLHEDVLYVASGSYERPNGYLDGIRGKGYVVNALEAVLWALWSDNGSFKVGVLNAVNLGDDTDTTAAIYDQLAGALYGCNNIPSKWTNKLYTHKLLSCIGKWLYFQGTHYEFS